MGKTVYSYVWEELLITDDVISVVEAMADDSMETQRMIDDLIEEIKRYDDKYIGETVHGETMNEAEQEITNTEGLHPVIEEQQQIENMITEQQEAEAQEDMEMVNIPNVEEELDAFEIQDFSQDAENIVEDVSNDEASTNDENESAGSINTTSDQEADSILPDSNENMENL